METTCQRIAMWSGPRNISTAMMRAWGNRGDTFVCDEPFYANYLRVTGKDHPGRAETLRAHESDWRRVVDQLLGPIPSPFTIFYQKQMAHHLLPGIDRAWIDCMKNCFLIREPREMLASLLKHVPDAVIDDTGLPQQCELFDRLAQAQGRAPPVIVARDVLENPQGILRQLCLALDVDFDPRMLHWPAGLRETDGAWAPFWYPEVARTTSFGKYTPRPVVLPDSHVSVCAECEQLYAWLADFRLRAL